MLVSLSACRRLVTPILVYNRHPLFPAQVWRYLSEYSRTSGGLPAGEMERLAQLYVKADLLHSRLPGGSTTSGSVAEHNAAAIAHGAAARRAGDAADCEGVGTSSSSVAAVAEAVGDGACNSAGDKAIATCDPDGANAAAAAVAAFDEFLEGAVAMARARFARFDHLRMWSGVAAAVAVALLLLLRIG